MKNPTVYVVHCIDTEGPLNETLDDTFERLEEVWGIKLDPTIHNLIKLQKKQFELNGIEQAVAEMLDPNLLSYNRNWKMMDEMLDDLLSSSFRNKFPDSFNSSWIYNWFLVDHVGYSVNPREREIGYHKIFDYYSRKLSDLRFNGDGFHFHFHPMPFNRAAHNCGTSYLGHSDNLLKILSRKIIERKWFPCVYRPGFHVTRPDSHWFLEQYVPIEYANQSTNNSSFDQPDLANGRFGDWRRAPTNWQPYHPSHDDYQIPGECRRIIARCLNVGTRHRLLHQTDVNQAFEEAKAGLPVVLAFTHHDYRDMRPDIRNVYSMLIRAKSKFPSVKFKYCEAKEAIKLALGTKRSKKIHLKMNLDGKKLSINSNVPTFGPQPFLALETKSGEFLWDNCDFQKPNREWSYTLDEHTILLKDLKSIGVASCDKNYNICVSVKNLETMETTTRQM